MFSGRLGAHRRPVARPRQSGRVIRRVLAVVLLFGAAGGGFADAQTIEDLRAKAGRIQAELQDTREEIEIQAEAYNRAMVDKAEAESEAERATAHLAQVQLSLDARRANVANFALTAYVRGGAMSKLQNLLAGDPNEAGTRLSYLKTATGDSQQAIDELRTAMEDVHRLQGQLDRARSVANIRAEEADRRRSAAGQAAKQHREILDGLDGNIAELVRQEEARVQAAEQAAAQAAAGRGAADRAAAANTEARASRPLIGASTDNNRPLEDNEPEPVATPEARPPRPATPGGIRPAAAIAMDAAYDVIGIPYVWAGANPSQGFDCSGLVQWAWGQAGRDMSHAADWQRDESEPISENELEPGDLVFYGEPPSHVAIYAGAGQIVNAPYTGEYVRVQSMYYSSKPMTFGRVN